MSTSERFHEWRKSDSLSAKGFRTFFQSWVAAFVAVGANAEGLQNGAMWLGVLIAMLLYFANAFSNGSDGE